MSTSPTWKSLKSASMFWQHRCWHLAPLTTLLGHGGTFLWFSCRQNAMLSSPCMAQCNPTAQSDVKYKNTLCTNPQHLVFQGPPATAHHLEQTETTPNPLMLQQSSEKMQKQCQCHPNTHQHFHAVSATIGQMYAPIFSCTNPQGVQSDSLESFRAVGEGELVDTPVLHAFFAHAASAIKLYVL